MTELCFLVGRFSWPDAQVAAKLGGGVSVGVGLGACDGDAAGICLSALCGRGGWNLVRRFLCCVVFFCWDLIPYAFYSSELINRCFSRRVEF